MCSKWNLKKKIERNEHFLRYAFHCHCVWLAFFVPSSADITRNNIWLVGFGISFSLFASRIVCEILLTHMCMRVWVTELSLNQTDGVESRFK